MLIINKSEHSLSEADVTDEVVYHSRRTVLKKLGFTGAGALLSGSVQADILDIFGGKKPKTVFHTSPLVFQPSATTSDQLTPEAKVTSYNNFYEFGTDKTDPVEKAQGFKVNPWQLTVSGEVTKPLTLDYDDLFKRFTLEERIYRLRCVEAWSMVIPWVGFSLTELLKLAQPNSNAKYVAFKTLYDPCSDAGAKKQAYWWWY